MGTFRYEDISAQEHFGMGIFWHHGHFGMGMLRHWKISEQGYFGTWTCAEMSMFQNILVPKCPFAIMYNIIVYVAKSPWC